MFERPQPNDGLNSRASRMLFEIRTLPDSELDIQFQSLVSRNGAHKQMLTALTLLVHLAQNGSANGPGTQGTMLFHGPTGTGKSTLAALLPQQWAVNASSRAKLARVNAHALASSEHGQSQKNVVRLFDAAAELCRDGVPLFLSFDELENSATDRNEISGKTSPIDARNSVNALLEQLDRKPSNCFVLASTNVPKLLDPAALGRFDFCFHVPSPDGTARLHALTLAIAAINANSPALRQDCQSDLDELVTLTKGFCFRQLKSVPMWAYVLHDGDLTLKPRQLLAAAKYIRKFNPLSLGD